MVGPCVKTIPKSPEECFGVLFVGERVAELETEARGSRVSEGGNGVAELAL